MSRIDWGILVLTLLCVVLYGIWKSRGTRSIKGFFLAGQNLPWYHVGLSVMATQASAITFLSAPGQAFTDGIRFVQFYFGLPLAMIVLCITFVPAFRKLNVYTAYEYLETRFDLKTRTLTAFLFLLQRGLSTGITIYAPAIVLSVILRVDISHTIIITGLLVILYTVYGGTIAVSHTHLFQMIVIFFGLLLAAYMVVHLLPGNVGLKNALHVAGKMGRLNAIDTSFDWNNRYNLWSGLIGGFFLQLSYFGTDQSQVGRYLTGSSVAQSRLGLIMNGLIKIPMQFFILLIGALVFSFYQFNQPPVFFNPAEVSRIENSVYRQDFQILQSKFINAHEAKKQEIEQLISAIGENNIAVVDSIRPLLQEAAGKSNSIREEVAALMRKNNPAADTNDSNYVFLGFITQQLPTGIIGLLVAVIFLASMGSASGGINSLASTTVVDFYKRHSKKTRFSDVSISRWITVGWGIFCIVVALYASRLGNLIEAVNILGSLFYGTILGVFLVAFYLKRVNGTNVFIAAAIAESFVVFSWYHDLTAFLWLNVTGALIVLILSSILQALNDVVKK
ncbi:MAG: sodium:solute symporter [Crocinitomicaceae bacterium]|nr:sodium:solute symporter [Crocinitomicaceae bacterium]